MDSRVSGMQVLAPEEGEPFQTALRAGVDAGTAFAGHPVPRGGRDEAVARLPAYSDAEELNCRNTSSATESRKAGCGDPEQGRPRTHPLGTELSWRVMAAPTGLPGAVDVSQPFR